MVDLTRRSFIKISAAFGAFCSFLSPRSLFSATKVSGKAGSGSVPVVISTWNHGISANKAAIGILSSGGRALDAVEAGVRVSEADPEVTSVGYGGLPDEEGKVTLDASIMGPHGNAGSVACVEGFMHPVSIARKVMEETEHVMLAGPGAEKFAAAKGFKREDLLTAKAREAWKKWKSEKERERFGGSVSEEDHDTIGMLAIDGYGDIAAACTTSGMAFKLRGRVGDSPIVGAGMYCDNEVGAAAATGLGEAVIRTCGSFLVVELMKNGLSPRDACAEAVNRIVSREGGVPGFQVGYIALNKRGETGGFSIKSGFEYAVADRSGNRLIKAESME